MDGTSRNAIQALLERQQLILTGGAFIERAPHLSCPFWPLPSYLPLQFGGLPFSRQQGSHQHLRFIPLWCSSRFYSYQASRVLTGAKRQNGPILYRLPSLLTGRWCHHSSVISWDTLDSIPPRKTPREMGPQLWTPTGRSDASFLCLAGSSRCVSPIPERGFLGEGSIKSLTYSELVNFCLDYCSSICVKIRRESCKHVK